MNGPAPGDRSEGLFRHSLLLFLATQVGSGANLLFQVAMNRTLSDAEFGILGSMLSLVIIVSTPMEAIRTLAAHRTALFQQDGRQQDVMPFLRGWLRRLLAAGCCTAAAGVLFAAPLSRFFQLPAVFPLLQMSVILAGSLLIPLVLGIMQGLQAFGWMSVAGQSWGVARMVLALAFVAWWGPHAVSALWGQMAAVAVVLALGAVGLRRRLPPGGSPANPGAGTGRYFMKTFFVMAAFAVLMNADIPLVKHYFDPETAGRYIRASTIGRAIVFLPMPIALAMFPKVATMGATTAQTRRTLGKALLYVGVIIAASAGGCWLLAPWIWKVFTGALPDPDMLRWLRFLVGAMAPLGVAWLLLNYELAQHRFGPALVLPLCAAAYLVLAVARHGRIEHIMAALMAGSVSASLLLLAGLRPRAKRLPASAP